MSEKSDIYKLSGDLATCRAMLEHAYKRIEELEADKEDLQQAVWELQDVIDAMDIER